MTNPLLAAADHGEKSPWSGVWIAEDIELIAEGVRGGSWIDGTIGVVSAGLDALALAMDPIGGLLQYGIAWLIDHVKPLSDALDWLAGDAAQIAAHAQTWRNVAGSLDDQAAVLLRSVRWDVGEWVGAAADAYRGLAGRRVQVLRTLGRASETMALMVEAAGVLIGTVRVMVRDAVATVVSRLIVYAGELIATGGLAAPVVVGQVSSLCASWGAKIARWLKGLIASLRELGESMARLGRNVDDLKGAPDGRPDPRLPREEPDPPRAPADEEQRIRDLGMDPATGSFRAGEAETAQRVERELGIELRRSENPNVDWVDTGGTTYDAVGNFDSRHFDRQWPRLQERIMDHLEKADIVPVDVSRFSPEQVALVVAFIDDNGLGPRAVIVGR